MRPIAQIPQSAQIAYFPMSAARTLGAVLCGLALAQAACNGPPSTVTARCIDPWPEPAPPQPLAAPLSSVEPAIVWRTPLTLSPANDWILVTDTRVAMAAGGRLYLLDHDGNYVVGRTSVALERVSSAVADTEGNFYMVGQNAYSVTPDGQLRWLAPLGDVSATAPQAGRSIALGPDGTLYIGANDGALYALSTADGSRRWRRELVPDSNEAPAIVGGVGSALIAVSRAQTGLPQLFDARTGVPMARWPTPAGDRYGAMAGPALGIVTQRMADRGGPYPWMDIAVLDACSRTRWELPASRPQWPALIGPGDTLYVVERDDVEGSQTYVSVYRPDGTRALGPVPAAPPWALGADGTLYGLECTHPGHDGPSRLIAYDSDLREAWRLELGASCPHSGPVIDAAGRLYFAWHIESVTELVAVQTPSPGLAHAAWPTRRRDIRGTAWVE